MDAVRVHKKNTKHKTKRSVHVVHNRTTHPQFWIFMSSITVPIRDVSTSLPWYGTVVGLSWPSTQMHLSMKDASSSFSSK